MTSNRPARRERPALPRPGLATALALALLAPGKAEAQCVSPGFVLPAAVPFAGLGPRDVVLADFDRDGHLDVATADFDGDTVTVNWGLGLGDFEPIPTVIPMAPSAGPRALAVGDVDGNGTPDIVVALFTSQRILPALKNVAGRDFTVGNTLDLDNEPLDLALGDFDRDGALDVVTAGQTGKVQFSFNDGTGTFTNGVAPVPAPVGQVNALDVADFNRDGFLDVVLARGPSADVVLLLDDTLGGYNESLFPAPVGNPEDVAVGDVDRDGDVDVVLAVQNANEVNVLLGNGGGGFDGTELFDTGAPQGGVALGDFNLDGILDIVASSNFAYATGLGDGTGMFGPVDYWAGEPKALAVGDIDADGNLDVAGVNHLAVGLSMIFGIGTFPCPETSLAGAGRLQAPLGETPVAIARGDWNRDGIPDLATAGGAILSVLAGDGTLRFAAPANHPLPVSADARAIAVGDFNLDSQPDLAVANFGTNDVSVFLNNLGVFVGPTSVPVGASPRGVVSGNFDGDGAPDLVTADAGGLSLTCRSGAGDGTFPGSLTTGIGLSGIAALAAADVDGDLKLDVAVTSDVDQTVSWYGGDGACGFALLGSRPVGIWPRALAFGDLNGDGRPDLVTANSTSGTVSVLLNTGGSFTPPASFTVGTTPRSLAIGRVDADAFLDIVVANYSSADVTVLLGDGAGGFSLSTTVDGYLGPQAVTLLDADRNRRLDLAVVHSAAAGALVVVPGDGLGGFGPPNVSYGSGVRSVAGGDFDRNGRPDLITLADFTDELTLVPGNGDGTFAAPASFSTGLPDPQALAVADFDRDGAADVLVDSGTGPDLAVLLGDGAGGFAPPIAVTTPSSGTFRYGLATGDFDRDGILDFAKVGMSTNDVTVHYGDGTGDFDPATFTVGVPLAPRGIAVIDFDRDGILDLAVGTSSFRTVTLLQGQPGRSFVRLLPDLATSGRPTALTAADFDGDGFEDLAVAQDTPSIVGYYPGTGVSPFFDVPTDYPLGATTRCQALAVADLNADGVLDLATPCGSGAGEDYSSLRVLLGTGVARPAPTFGAPDVWTVALRSPGVIDTADLDRNGKPDLVVAQNLSIDEGVSILLNTNCLARRLRVTQNVSPCNDPDPSPLSTQPIVQVEDDGANRIRCDTAAVTASIVPGTGEPFAALLGENPRPTTNGLADWSTAAPPLSIDLAGKKYRLEFQHPVAGWTFSRTFSLAPTVTITGPASYCAASSAFFSTDPGFDTYRWLVNPPFPNPLSFAESLTLGAGALGAGSYVTQVNATVDTCPAGANAPVDVFDDLSSVSVAPPGPESVCTSCTGSNLTVTETGGGAVTRRWGYRASPGGAITYLTGQTGPAYLINGSDFPGQGTYYVVEETTPQCGVATVSNEVQVQVTVTAISDVPPVFTVTSTDGQNRLEWAYPPGRTKVRIRYNTDSDWLSCTPPANEADGAGLGDVIAPVNFVNHSGLTNDDTYCYSIFVETGVGVFPVTTRRTTKGRPFDTSGPVKWAYSTGASSMAPPGLGLGVVHVVSNDEILHSVVKGLGGGWPASWTPFVANGPSQSRPSTVGISVPPAGRVVYLGSQAAAGNNSVAVDADTGMGLWGQPLGAPVQAGPAGIFSAYGGSMDAILLGTFDGGSPNAFQALDPFTGNPLPGWPYGGEPPNEIGRVSAQAAVDYVGDRVFFTSYHHAAGTDSVWCVDLATGGRCPLWPVGVTAGLDHVAASPTLRSGVLYVAPINGEIHALDANDANPRWAAPFLPGDGQVKLFMLPDFFSTDLYFSTTSMVWSIRDDGATAGLNWQRAGIPSPSQPVYFAGSGRVWVGAGDGSLYILNASDGLNTVTAVNPIPLGDGTFAVGAPTVDQAGGFVYVGTDAGVVYAVVIP